MIVSEKLPPYLSVIIIMFCHVFVPGHSCTWHRVLKRLQDSWSERKICEITGVFSVVVEGKKSLFQVPFWCSSRNGLKRQKETQISRSMSEDTIEGHVVLLVSHPVFKTAG